ncbi:SEL1-like repeat protein [Sphingobium sp. LMC3-1-1.1]|jgi:hypothetical protein|uniref:tetratricopeptide repeat protein n=1 Tax=Sphingobium sp. LMC3-1-1.1 TaxID=3135241 RepID=UPI0034474CB1
MILFAALLLSLGQAPVTQSVTQGTDLRLQPIDALKKAAKRRDKRAQYELGRRYETGDGIKPNLTKAIQWYKRASSFDVIPKYVYSGPVGNEEHGRAIEIGPPTVIPGFALAQERLKSLLQDGRTKEKFGISDTENVHVSHRINQFTPSVKNLLEVAEIDIDRAMELKAYEKPIHLKIGGLDGYLKLQLEHCDTGKENCSVQEVSFQADIPVGRCVSMERAETYLLQYGWKRHEVSSSIVIGRKNMSLPPISQVFNDPKGATLSLGPYIKQGCITQAILSNLDGQEKK